MTKNEFDAYFISQLPRIEDVARRLISKYKKHHLDYGIVISYTYEHTLKFIDDYDTENKCQRYIFKFITSNIVWYNSEMNSIEGIAGDIVDSYDISNEDDESDFENKLLIERWYSNKKAVLNQYRLYEPDKVKQIVFDCFFVKGIIVGVLLAKHLGINKDAGCKLIRDMKFDIRQFENSQYRYGKND